MLVLFDPNVLISALITPAGIARHVVQLGIEGRFEYVICPTLLHEVEDVAARPKIAERVPPEAAQRFVSDLRGAAQAEADPELAPISRDPKDDYLVALAVSVRADHLVTGDKDLLSLADPPIHIVGLRDFADLLDEQD